MQTFKEYWIERKSIMGDWEPIDKSNNHREAVMRCKMHKAKCEESGVSKDSIRLLCVTWEVIDV
jgi:hypothetical protein